ncbi:hypothetical protein L7F22_021960 [Adiantum nelumboides]|nr:hypothetical protein [Adiantum nelumboides]
MGCCYCSHPTHHRCPSFTRLASAPWLSALHPPRLSAVMAWAAAYASQGSMVAHPPAALVVRPSAVSPQRCDDAEDFPTPPCGGDGSLPSTPRAPQGPQMPDIVADASTVGVKQKRKPRVTTGSIKDLVETTKQLTIVFADTEAARTVRYEEFEKQREEREEKCDHQLLEIELAKINAMKENTGSRCSSLSKIVDSISSLGPLP